MSTSSSISLKENLSGQEYLKSQVEALYLDINGFFTIAKIKPQLHNELHNKQIARQFENFNGCKPMGVSIVMTAYMLIN